MGKNIRALQHPTSVNHLEFEVDTRIFPIPVVQKVLYTLRDSFSSLEVEEDENHDMLTIVLQLARNPVVAPEKVRRLFYGRLIGVRATEAARTNAGKIAALLPNTADHVVTNTYQLLEGCQRLPVPVEEPLPIHSLREYSVRVSSRVMVILNEEETVARLQVDARIGDQILKRIWQGLSELRASTSITISAPESSVVVLKVKPKDRTSGSLCRDLVLLLKILHIEPFALTKDRFPEFKDVVIHPNIPCADVIIDRRLYTPAQILEVLVSKRRKSAWAMNVTMEGTIIVTIPLNRDHLLVSLARGILSLKRSLDAM